MRKPLLLFLQLVINRDYSQEFLKRCLKFLDQKRDLKFLDQKKGSQILKGKLKGFKIFLDYFQKMVYFLKITDEIMK